MKLHRGRGRRVVQEELDQTLFFSFLKHLSQLSRTDFEYGERFRWRMGSSFLNAYKSSQSKKEPYVCLSLSDDSRCDFNRGHATLHLVVLVLQFVYWSIRPYIGPKYYEFIAFLNFMVFQV